MPMTYVLLILIIGFVPTVGSAQTYPDRPITMIVPFPPGGVADLIARPLAISMEKILKQPIVVTNRPGAGGVVGMAAAANAKPDGYTIMVALSSITYMHEVDTLFKRPKTYTPDNFVPLAMLTADPLVMAVHADSPWKTVEDFVANANRRQGAVKLGSAGIYSVMHVGAELFFRNAGIRSTHIPYTGGGPTLTALLGKHIDCAAFGPNVIVPYAKAGTVRPLVVLGDKRLNSMPNTPTAKEIGIDAEFYIWSGVFAVNGTPEPAVKTLRDAVREAVRTTQFVYAMEKLETPMRYMEQSQFKNFLQVDEKRSVHAVREIGNVH